MAHSSTLIVAFASALCVHTVLAYPTSMERVPGDNNYLPLRNTPSRDFERFIDTFCDDGNQCNSPRGMMATVVRDTLDRLNGGHYMVAKRSSLDRLNGGHVMVARRSSLDRLNGGHVMVAKRRSLDRLNGGHVMVAKRSSLDRLNGGHVMVAKRSQPDRFNDGLATITESLVPEQLQQQQAPNYQRTSTPWPEIDDYYLKDGDDLYIKDYDGDDCSACGSSAKVSSF